MKTVELGHTGEQVSHLALGCMLMGTATDEVASTEMLNRFVAAGGTFLDTADCYDDPAKRDGHHAMAPYEGPDAQARIAVLAESQPRRG